MTGNTRYHRRRPWSVAWGILAILAVSVLALVPLSAASAEGETPPTPVWGDKVDERLEAVLLPRAGVV